MYRYFDHEKLSRQIDYKWWVFLLENTNFERWPVELTRFSQFVSDVDPIQLMKFIAGLLLFSYAGTLSSNQIFYYLCGITLGICGSVVILMLLICRIFPSVSIWNLGLLNIW